MNLLNRLLNVYLLSLIVINVNAQSIAYSTLYDNASFSSKTIDVSNPIGSIEGVANISSTGSVNYSIPIKCPPGTNGIVPSLSIVYNSNGANGLLGQGWNLSGLSAITRSGKDFYHNMEQSSPITYTNNDAFVLDGTWLVPVSGTNGENGTSYKTESESYSVTTSYGIGSPQYFNVVAKDGTIMQYGNSTDSRIMSDDGTKVMMWRLNKIQDVNGNYITFTYTFTDRDSRISQIKYTGNDATGLLPYNEINFQYAIRSDKSTIYDGGYSLQSKYLLWQIQIQDATDIYKTYQFYFGKNASSNSYLKYIDEFAGDGSKLNDTRFKYGDEVNNISVVESNIELPDHPVHPTSGYTYAYFEGLNSGDFDGDGINEIYVNAIRSQIQSYPTSSPESDISFNVYKSGGFGSSTYSSHALTSYKMYHNIGTVPLMGSVNRLLLPYDYKGDGKDDIYLYKINGSELDKRTIYHSNSTSTLSFNSYDVDPIVNPAPYSSGKYVTKNCNIHGDFDGDRAMDFITIIKDGVGNNLATVSFPRKGWYNMYITTSTVPYTPSAAQASLITDPDMAFVIDINGDGKSELLTYKKDTKTINVYALNERAYGKYSIDLLTSVSSIDCDEIIPGDYNGDGKTDLVYYKKSTTTTTVRMLYSNGLDFWQDITSIAFYPNDCGSEVGDRMYATDFNGDGKTDILVFKRDCSSYFSHSYFNVYYSNSLAHFDYQSIELADAPDNTVSPLIADVNGDGLSDFVYKSVYSRKLKIISFSGRPRSQLLEKITDGFNRTTEFTYEPLSKGTGTGSGDFYSKGSGETYPINNVQYPVYVATSVKYIDGIGGINTTNYKYSNLRFYRGSGRGLLGFHKITKINTNTDLKVVSTYDFDRDFYVPYLRNTETFVNSTGVQLTWSKNTFYFDPVGPTSYCYAQKNIKSEEQDFLIGVSKVTDNTFDAYGNITNSTTTITGGETFTSSTVSTYVAATTGVSIPNKASSIITTYQRGSMPSASNKSLITYDSKGRVTTLTTQPEPYVYLTNILAQDFEYDAYGNNKRQQNRTVVGMIPSSLWSYTEYLYDTKGRYMIEQTNTVGDKSTFTYHKFWGKPLSITGVNGLTTTHSYDNWGKLSSTTIPTSASSSYTVSYSDAWDISGNQLFYTLIQDPSAPDVKTWYDYLGRGIKTQQQTFGGAWTTANVTYDSKGNLATSTNNYLPSETPITTTKSYDALNRLASSSDVFGTTSYTYSLGSGLSTTAITLPDGKVRSSTADASGKLLKSTNGIAGTVHYTYDSRGNEINSGLGTTGLVYHNLIQKEYDAKGRLKKLIDPDAGTTSYIYNALDQLVKQTDPKGKETLFEYNDIMGRITKKTLDGYVTEYSYFDKTKNYQIQQVKVTGPDGIVIDNFDYTEAGNVVKHNKNINSVILEKNYTYDGYNNLSTTEYIPSYFKTKNHYDGNGFLQKMTTNFGGTSLEKTLYENTAMNGNEQITDFKRIDGTNASILYDKTFPIHYQTSGKQDLWTAYDYQNGNVLSRSDHIPSSPLSEAFTYDPIDRLIKSVSGGASGIAGPIINPPIDISYNNGFWGSFGQIASKSDVGTYSYGGFPRNAVKSVTDPAGIISHATQNIVYNPFHKTQKITETIGTTDYEEKFVYDANQDRAYSQQSQGTAPTSTIVRKRWYMDDFEIDQKISSGITTNHRLHYITGDAGLVGIVVEEAGNYNYYSVYTDHLGSIVKVTNDAGTVVAEQNYDAWGRERDPSTWGYTGIFPKPDWLCRGYTGHEMLPEYGLINMNGRMYDPINGRMMRPDNFVQDPSNAQSYNRYSYCINNPMKYTDPSGQIILPLLLLTKPGYEIQKQVSPIALKINTPLGSDNRGFGLDLSVGMPKALGIGYRANWGATYYTKTQGVESGWETRNGGEWFLGPLSFSGTRFSGLGRDQVTNRISYGGPLFNFSYENDTEMPGFMNDLPGIPHIDNTDRWRTAAASIRVGGFEIGMNLHTGSPDVFPQGNFPMHPSNFDPDDPRTVVFTGGTANHSGYRSGILYMGSGPIRIGVNSETVRHIFQNRMAHDGFFSSWGGQRYPWYKTYRHLNSFYFQFGSGSGDTNW